MSDTVFDKILAGELPAEKVYEDDKVLAFKDIYPQAPVHVLVVPKKRIERFAQFKEWEQEDIGYFLLTVSKVATQLGLDEKGYRIVFNNGPDGGQEVEYLHAHILGGRSMKWPPG